METTIFKMPTTVPVALLSSNFKKFTLFMALFVLATAMHARGSELEITLWNNQPFEIELDHKKHYCDNQFFATDLRSGQHRVKITQRRQNQYGNAGRVTVLYDGYIQLEKRSRLVAVIRPNRRLAIVETIYLRPNGNVYTSNNTYAINNQAGGVYAQTAYGNAYGNQGMTCGNGGFQSDFYNQACSCGNGCAPGMCGNNSWNQAGNIMSDWELDDLIYELNGSWFDDDKLEIAKRRIRKTRLSSFQVLRIMKTFDFDCHKLDFAKYAYDKVVDPHNFHVVDSGFDFTSNVHELHEYIY